jgi:HD-like signal output (HDOD) protein
MRLVLADREPHVAAAHLRALKTVRPQWTVTLAHDVFSSLTALAETSPDVFISDLGDRATDGVALFETVKERSPGTVRIALSEFVERSLAIRLERCVHRFIHQPCDTFVLAMIVERSTTLRHAIDDPAILDAVGGLSALPRPPVTVQALEKVLADPDAGIMSVAAVVSRDAALAARLLRVVNSAFFGMSRQVTRVDAAVNFLGIALVRAIAMADGIVRSFSLSPDVIDIDEWNTHSVRVAMAAREIAAVGCPQDKAVADEAFLAGLLHDVGQIVLAGVAPDRWREICHAADRGACPTIDAEREAGGATHAMVGAYLLSIWGLPSSVVEAVAFHHSPEALAGAVFDATLAVHIADALVTRPNGRAAPPLHLETIAANGVSDGQLDAWRERFSSVEVEA